MYEVQKDEYIKLEKELADPKTTEARKKDIKKDMEKLGKDLTESGSLPVANTNPDRKPGDFDIDCDE